MKPLQNSMFMHSQDHSDIVKKLKSTFSARTNAKWVIVTRNEYRRLQAMQGVLLIILLCLTGVMLG